MAEKGVRTALALAICALGLLLPAGASADAGARRVVVAHSEQQSILRHGLVTRIRVRQTGMLVVRAVARQGGHRASLRHVRVHVGRAGQRKVRLYLTRASRKLIGGCGRTKLLIRATERRRKPRHLARMRRQAVVRVNSPSCRRSGATGSADPEPGVPRKPMIFDPGQGALAWAKRDQALDMARDLGVDTVRLELTWAYVAPAARPAGFDPTNPSSAGYDWNVPDDFMEAAAARGLKVNMLLRGPAPAWASDSFDPLSPRPADFGQFVTAAATRYSGHYDPPGARAVLSAPTTISLWNEPNLSPFLRPQFKNGSPYSPILYRQMYLAGQSAIEANAPGVSILIGETAPTGSYNSVDPVDFARGVLCADSYAKASAACRSGKVDAVGWSTHPYSIRDDAPFEPSSDPGYAPIGDLTRLESALDAGAAAGQVAPELPIWITESGIQSDPDENGVPAATQADYISISEYLAYADPRVATAAQYLMWDDPLGSGVYGQAASFQTGLIAADGTAKPAATAFRMPLVARRSGNAVSLWGLVRPANGSAPFTILARDPGGQPFTVLDGTTSGKGMLATSAEWAQGRQWQLVWHSPGGDVSGEWTSSYSFAVSAAGAASATS